MADLSTFGQRAGFVTAAGLVLFAAGFIGWFLLIGTSATTVVTEVSSTTLANRYCEGWTDGVLLANEVLAANGFTGTNPDCTGAGSYCDGWVTAYIGVLSEAVDEEPPDGFTEQILASCERANP